MLFLYAAAQLGNFRHNEQLSSQAITMFSIRIWLAAGIKTPWSARYRAHFADLFLQILNGSVDRVLVNGLRDM
jgi:hypothetical protein